MPTIKTTINTLDIRDAAVKTAKILDANVTAGKLASDSVLTAKIVDLNVTTGKLADSAATAAKLASDSVTTAKILNANVTAAKLASDSVTTAKILDANVTTAKIADSAVTTAKINDAAVTAAKLATDSVTTVKILNSNVTTAKIADLAVTGAKLETILDGTTNKVPGAYTNVNLTVDAKGRITLIQSGVAGELTADNFKWNQPVTGTQDDSNNVFTVDPGVDMVVTTGSMRVYKNGLRQRPGSGNDYTVVESTGTITFLAGNLPNVDDNILVDFMVEADA